MSGYGQTENPGSATFGRRHRAKPTRRRQHGLEQSKETPFDRSGRRDSNPRQPAWKAGTLPPELLPHTLPFGSGRADLNRRPHGPKPCALAAALRPAALTILPLCMHTVKAPVALVSSSACTLSRESGQAAFIELTAGQESGHPLVIMDRWR